MKTQRYKGAGLKLVAVSRLKPGMVVARSIFGNTGQRLLRQGVEITDRYIQQLQRYGIGVIYVSTGQDVVPRDVISDETRQQAVRETKRVLQNVQRGAALEMESIHEVLVKIIDELFLQDDIMVNLVDIRSHDEELFSHSVNVAILSVITGIELELSQEELQTLATVGLLHEWAGSLAMMSSIPSGQGNPGAQRQYRVKGDPFSVPTPRKVGWYGLSQGLTGRRLPGFLELLQWQTSLIGCPLTTGIQLRRS